MKTTTVTGTKKVTRKEEAINSLSVIFSRLIEKSYDIKIKKILDILSYIDKEEIEAVEKFIKIPNYQRNQLHEDNSKFVAGIFANILLKLGVPSSIILAYDVNGSAELMISKKDELLKEDADLIDGLQRICALIAIYILNVPFEYKKLNKNQFTSEQLEYLIRFNGETFESLKENCEEAYNTMKELSMAIYCYYGLTNEEKVYLFYRLNGSMTKLSKEEMNHSAYVGTPIYDLARRISADVDEKIAGKDNFVGKCLQGLGSDKRFKRTNIILKLLYITYYRDCLNMDPVSTDFSDAVVAFLSDENINNSKNAISINAAFESALLLMEDYGLLNISKNISLSPDGSKKNGTGILSFISSYAFALMYKDNIEEHIAIDLIDEEAGKINVVDLFETYIHYENYKTSFLATDNNNAAGKTGKVYVNAYVWNKMLEHAIAQEDYHETHTDFDFNAARDEAKATCAKKGRSRSK